MTDMINQTSADALSKLIQMQASRYDIRLAWSGKGTDDLVALCSAHAAKARLSKHLWNGVRELMQMPELKQLPESMQAQILSIILGAQSLVELSAEDHAKRLADVPSKPRGSA